MKRSKKGIDPDTEKARARNRASRIRVKLRDQPGDVTPDERAFLAEYDQRYGRAVPPIAPAEAPAAPEAPAAAPLEAPATPPPPVSGAPSEQPSTVPIEPPTARRIFSPPPPLPTPPRVASPAASSSAAPAGDWRAKYAYAGGGREMACELFGGSIWEAVIAMEAAITESGGKPVMSAREMRGVFVLAADEILPPHVELTPTILAASATATTTLQAFVRRKAIQDAAAKKKRLGVVQGGRAAAPAEPAKVIPIVDEERAAPASDVEPPAASSPPAPAPEPVLGPHERDYPPPPEAPRPRLPKDWEGIA